MPFEITDLIPLIGKKVHPNYEKTVELAKKINCHFSGEVPEKLIDQRRPSETEAIKKYRREIYVPKTKNPIGKVINSLSKIRRSQDWSIEYKSDAVPSTVTSDESLQKYCEENFPAFDSITNWIFSEVLIRYLIDANSVIAVFPEKYPVEPNQYLRPIAEIFSSEQVVDCVPGEYMILRSSELTQIGTGPSKKEGKVFYIVTDTKLAKVAETTARRYEVVYEYIHSGKMPCWKVGGIYFSRANNDIIFQSRIATMVPDLDEAAREYSDLQAEIVQHIHSEKYFYTNAECPICRGTGRTTERDANGEFKKCTTCGGLGSIRSVSPYGEYIINIGQKGIEQQLPTPPVGYVEKSVEIAKLQDERVRQHIYDALASINMEFLAEAPLSQSGVAKEVDRDELNNFVNSIAEDLVANMDRIYYFINEIRYSVAVSDSNKRRAMLPKVSVPEKYDILNSKYLMEEVQAARTANVNPVLVKYMEIEYARKKYNADTAKASELEAIFDLDPLYGYTQDEKMTMLGNGGISKEDYVISSNIRQFVGRAIEEKKEGFYKMKLSEKQTLIKQYCTEKNAEISTASQIRNQIDNDGTE